jgi:hypothetical protein
MFDNVIVRTRIVRPVRSLCSDLTNSLYNSGHNLFSDMLFSNKLPLFYIVGLNYCLAVTNSSRK